MPWTLDDTRPIYLQLEDIIKSKIIAGIYKPGQKLPSVREPPSIRTPCRKL